MPSAQLHVQRLLLCLHCLLCQHHLQRLWRMTCAAATTVDGHTFPAYLVPAASPASPPASHTKLPPHTNTPPPSPPQNQGEAWADELAQAQPASLPERWAEDFQQQEAAAAGRQATDSASAMQHTRKMLDVLSSDPNPKMRNSKFLQFLSKMSNGELILEDNKVGGRGRGRGGGQGGQWVGSWGSGHWAVVPELIGSGVALWTAMRPVLWAAGKVNSVGKVIVYAHILQCFIEAGPSHSSPACPVGGGAASRAGGRRLGPGVWRGPGGPQQQRSMGTGFPAAAAAAAGCSRAQR